jgi:hypothetical protein
VITQADVDLYAKWVKLRDEYVASKATRDTNPTKYAKAKAAMSAERLYWRQIREALALAESGE